MFVHVSLYAHTLIHSMVSRIDSHCEAGTISIDSCTFLLLM